ncbi:hypothetical protein WR25_16742 isoform A [Diploscapter pachys]|uniref:Major facilitator superfamily (MFS) profile domain-containing protein n=1 Tax=Diploscapter pachys TaxID=2018661 RepID=A0A2A2JKZ8_9BILA|nr:hypothetical protein WR25_16742 isoform A [Diploscapter pachys]
MSQTWFLTTFGVLGFSIFLLVKSGDLKVDVGVPSSDPGAGDDVTGFWSTDDERDDRSKDSVIWKNLQMKSSSPTITIFSVPLPKPIFYTYILSILYNVSFFMQLTATPYLVKKVNVSDQDYGYFQTLFGFVQMIGGPLFGYAIQKFGIRWALHLCYFSTVLSGVSLYYSYNFTSLMLSRLPCLFMHGQQSHQTMLSALTQPGKERTVAFGRMGLTFGIGFLFAPATSILVTKLFHDTAPILFSAFLSIVPAIVLELYIDRKSYEGHENSPDTEQKNVVMNITNTVRILSKPGVVNVLLKKNFPVAPMLLTFSFMHVGEFYPNILPFCLFSGLLHREIQRHAD